MSTQNAGTLTDVDERAPRRAVWGRRLAIGLVAALVLAGLSGALGVRHRTAQITNAGYTLTVEHPAVARSGLDVRFAVRVEHSGGFGEQLVVSITADYFDLFETQGFFPEPSSVTWDGDDVHLQFDAPEGDEFTLGYDAFVEPTWHWGREAQIAVSDDGETVVSSHITTWVLP